VEDPAEFLRARDFLLAHRTNYDVAYRDFRWPQLDEFNWALDYFDSLAASAPAAVALWVVAEDGAETRLTFAELAARSNQAANFLRSLGVRRGDRVMVMLGNQPALWETLLAAFKLGAVVIPAATLLRAADLRDRLDRGEVRHVVAGAAHAGAFDNLAGSYTRIAAAGRVDGWHALDDARHSSTSFAPDGPTSANDPLLVYFTSGTTSSPKLVCHSHQSYPVGHLSTMYWIGIQPGDVHWNISSPGWAKHAWSCFFAPWNAGATVFAYDYARFNARDVLGVLDRCGITTLCAPPTVWRMLVQEDLARHPVHLREVASAGEPLNPEVIERVRSAWGLIIRDGFGQTETTAMIGNPPGQPVKPGSMGRPLPGYDVRLEDGEVCLDLAAPPAGLMLGYVGQPGARTNRHYRTGDLASQDDSGYITFVGRTDDVFKASDYRISPFELESALLEHPAIAEAAVVPCPDAVRTAVPKGFVVLAPGFEPGPELARDIFAFLRRTLAPYKRIRRLEFSELPKTISGKIRRVDLRIAEQTRGAGTRKDLEFFEDDFPDLKL
jgi:acetyl-CoA synthetase